jgi:hypothetical protein
MKDNREKNLNIRVSEEQLKEIKRRAKEQGLTQADYVIMKSLDLKAVKQDTVKEYTRIVRGKEYKQRVLIETVSLVPPDQVTT